jgi:hypothetical protein
MKGMKVTKLEFKACSFSAVELTAIMATVLSRKTSVISIIVHCRNARVLFGALAAALPSNSTLRELLLGRAKDDDSDCLSAVVLASGKNTGLKHFR